VTASTLPCSSSRSDTQDLGRNTANPVPILQTLRLIGISLFLHFHLNNPFILHTHLGFSVIAFVSIRWKYDLKVNVQETENNSKAQGFESRLLEGETKNFSQHYPLNQVKISGGNLSPKIRVHVGPNVTQIYYSLENPSTFETLQRMVSDVENTERILNYTIVFAPDENARLGKDTGKPVMSTSMLKLQIHLKDVFKKFLDDLGQFCMREIAKSFLDIAQGKPFLAEKRLSTSLDELTRFYAEIVKIARDQGLSQADKWDEDLKKILSDPFGSLGNICSKTDQFGLEF
jgi:hypothetical protein